MKKGAKDVANLPSQNSLAKNVLGVTETVNKINDWVKIKLFFKVMIK